MLRPLLRLIFEWSGIFFDFRKVLSVIFFWVVLVVHGQLAVSASNNATQLAQSIVGNGVIVSNATLTCASNASGTFTATNTNLGLSNGILLTTGSVNNSVGPNNTTSASTCNNGGSNSLLTSLSGVSTFDQCRLEFSVTPTSNSLSFRYVFGSEEYPEYAGSSFNDAFGFFISGPNPLGGNYNNSNMATLPNGQNVSINTVNHFTNTQYYINNTGGQTIQYDGFTTVLTASRNVIPCSTYTLILAIADGGDCSFDSGVFIEGNSLTSGTFTSTVTTTAATCTAGGSASINPTGGVPPYTYSWSNGGTGQSQTGLSPGNYTVNVSYSQCNQTITNVVPVTIIGPAPISASIAPTHALCANVNNGQAVASVTGGTSPFTYTWSNGLGGNTLPNIGAGTYSVTVTDANGCTATASTTITQPPPIVMNTLSQVSPLCATSNNGSIQVSASGGTGNLGYVWAPSGNTTTQNTGLAGGQHTITITDGNGCTLTQTYTLSSPPAIQSSIVNVIPVLCHGQSNGQVQASASGGTGSLSYLWSPSGGNQINAQNLAAGNYTLTITDSNGCVQQIAAVVTQPSVLVAQTPSVTHVTCNGLNNGTASVTAIGGTAPYSFLWSPGNGTSSTAIGLGPGSYTVQITDANGCVAQNNATIFQPQSLQLALINPQSPSCFNGSNGSIQSQVSGGTMPYSYSWSPNGGNSASATNLSAGTYTLTVQDANGCTSQVQATLVNPPQLTITPGLQTHISCFGLSNGSIQTSISGGTLPYQYTWNGVSSVSSNLSNVPSGSYTLVVTDALGCTAIYTTSLTQPTLLSLSIPSVNHVGCFGQSTGSASTLASGGTGPYTYLWNPGASVGSTLSNVPAGNYSVTVTDAQGCTATQNAIINQPSALNLTLPQISQITCHGINNGAIQSQVSGGTSPYQYTWSPLGLNTPNLSSLAPGVYTLMVTDAQQCSTSVSATITQPANIQIQTVLVQPVSCYGFSNGVWNQSVSGGTLPYSYTLNGNNVPSALISNLIAGSYQFVVTDANGCQQTSSVQVSQPDSLSISPLQISHVLCANGNNGSIVGNVSGGTLPYQYQWSPTGGNNSVASGLSAGSYTFTVTDQNGCTLSAQAQVTQPSILQIQSNQSADSLCLGEPITLSAQVSGGVGPYNSSWNGNSGLAYTHVPTISGNYVFQVTDFNGCSASISRSVKVGGLPTAAFNLSSGCTNVPVLFQQSSTMGNGEGSIQSYQWQINGNSFMGPGVSQSFPAPGNYNVLLVVSTNFGCIDSMLGQVIIHPSPQVSFMPEAFEGCAPKCIDMENLSTISAGSIPSWQWVVNGEPASTLSNPSLCFQNPGTYSIGLTATSNQGCVSTLNIPNLIFIAPPPKAEFQVSSLSVQISAPFIQFNDMSFNAQTFMWDFGDGITSTEQHPFHEYAEVGEYCPKLQVISPEGCLSVTSVCIKVLPDANYYIPNAFTPNRDGINEGFRVHGQGVSDVEMFIYDRWGGLVYYSRNVNAMWNGLIDESPASRIKQDVFVYRINVRDVKGIWREHMGHVNVIR